MEMLLAEMMVDGGKSRGSGGAIAAEEINSEWWIPGPPIYFYPAAPNKTKH